jgi:secondary thiamine-phosphate synthase enzyme
LNIALLQGGLDLRGDIDSAHQCHAHYRIVFINDDEQGLHADYEAWLEGLASHEPVSSYRHNRTGEDNADAHMERQIMGREVVVAITAGKLDFGPWEQIFYGEFDGGRRKRVDQDHW